MDAIRITTARLDIFALEAPRRDAAEANSQMSSHGTCRKAVGSILAEALNRMVQVRYRKRMEEEEKKTKLKAVGNTREEYATSSNAWRGLEHASDTFRNPCVDQE